MTKSGNQYYKVKRVTPSVTAPGDTNRSDVIDNHETQQNYEIIT